MPIVTYQVQAEANLTREQALDPDSWSADQSATYAVAHALPGIISQAFREIVGAEIEPGQVQVSVTEFGPIDQNTPMMWIKVEPMDRPGIYAHVEAMRRQITDQVADIVAHLTTITGDGIAVDILPLMGVGGLRRPGLPDTTW